MFYGGIPYNMRNPKRPYHQQSLIVVSVYYFSSTLPIVFVFLFQIIPNVEICVGSRKNPMLANLVILILQVNMCLQGLTLTIRSAHGSTS